MSKKEQLVNRLENWKFYDAYAIAKQVPFNAEHEVVKDIIGSLSRLYGNCGWFEGEVGCLIGRIVYLSCTVLEGGKL